MPCCRSAIQWDGLGQSAVSRSPMSSTRTDGDRLTAICKRPGAPCIIAETTGSAIYQPQLSSPVVFVIPEKAFSRARSASSLPLDRGFDVPRELQLFDASSGAIARVIWLTTVRGHYG